MSNRMKYRCTRDGVKLRGGRGDGNHPDLMPKNKIRAFKTLFGRIKKKIGNYKETVKALGIGNDAMSDLNSCRRLTATNAKKILSAYNNLCND